MPEAPEVEITARLIGEVITGARVNAVAVPGINALKSFDPPPAALVGATLGPLRRRGKLFLLDAGDDLTAVIHLMSAGRLQLHDRPAAPRDRTSRVLIGLEDGRQLRLREFGTRQRAWIKLLPRDALAGDETLASLGPEAWPDPPATAELQARLKEPRPLHALLRDQHVLAGIGRSWVDEILWSAGLSPFKRGSDLDPETVARLREAITDRLGGAVAHYAAILALPLPEKLGMPLEVHRRHGEPCPRCGTVIEAVHYEEYVMCYCPRCQTDGRVLKDRRLSRLLK
ncbi:DNA-formamidopyrimidine glycosylase family protein [Conexibacter sp. DBS9H8]|uniref:DNA-formamidopyrimidine glycosylase family protein n=1 Tax=Conexibacter sp. DBS9H8 TaxID=2937801 RepID=UPI00200BE9FC|nr:DNA-formamidopyrimidine glycosylase family protein [Conexibacter sp. DBS9H8]